MVCGCILGIRVSCTCVWIIVTWTSLLCRETHHFWVTVTLTSDLVFRIIMSGAYLVLFDVEIPNLVCGFILWWQSVMFQCLGLYDHDLVSRIIMSWACRCKLQIHFPQIRIELKISTYRIGACFCLYHTFLHVTGIFHPFQIKRGLILELICESIKIYAFWNHDLFLPQ